MPNVGAYLVVLVVGALIGASIIGYVITINQNGTTLDVKVTIQGISYKVSDSILGIELLNDVPEKNLKGKVIVSQGENQWVGDVDWDYTGFGEVEVCCESIDEAKSFRVAYCESSSEETYLDIMVGWDEVELDQVIGFMETSELTIVEMTFLSSVPMTINVGVTNSGTSSVSVAAVKINGETKGVFSGDTTFVPGSSGTITVSQEWTAGNKYSVSLFASDGTLVASYTDTAPA
jgi:hypothetical protein